MALHGDRIHRYVNVFCPLCHADVPDRPLASVARLRVIGRPHGRPDYLAALALAGAAGLVVWRT